MGMTELLHVQELLAWMSEPMGARLRLDSSAGRSVLLRARVNRIRDLEVKVFVGSAPDTFGTCYDREVRWSSQHD